MKILMVCLGNICRSPMAEGILRHKAQQNGWKIEVDSAGTGDWHAGESPDIRAMDFMDEQGINIRKLRARQITQNDFYYFDVILTMDAENYTKVMRIKPEDATAKVEMVMNLAHPGRNMAVPDPYFGGKEGFVKVYDMLDEALNQVEKQIKN